VNVMPVRRHVPACDGTCAHMQAAEDGVDDEEEEPEEAALEERDSETFDDGEFYQQLLKEFLESSGVDAAAVSASAQVCITAVLVLAEE
jgi:hypothetical protein